MELLTMHDGGFASTRGLHAACDHPLVRRLVAGFLALVLERLQLLLWESFLSCDLRAHEV